MKEIYVRNIDKGVKINTDISLLGKHEEKDILNILEENDELVKSNSIDLDLLLKDGYLFKAKMLNDECAIILDNNIYLLYLGKKERYSKYSKYVPWYYPENKIYLGDSWYFEDEEILKDLQGIDTLNFLIKYYFGK